MYFCPCWNFFKVHIDCNHSISVFKMTLVNWAVGRMESEEFPCVVGSVGSESRNIVWLSLKRDDRLNSDKMLLVLNHTSLASHRAT